MMRRSRQNLLRIFIDRLGGPSDSAEAVGANLHKSEEGRKFIQIGCFNEFPTKQAADMNNVTILRKIKNSILRKLISE